MQTITVSIDRMSSGSAMPSRPRWYRLLITLIHGSLTSNCIVPAALKSNRKRIPMPTAPVATAVSSAVALIAVSWACGIASTTAIPTAGRNTASVNAQSSNQSIASYALPIRERS